MKRATFGLFALAMSGFCSAAPISITVTGTGTGTLGAQVFTNAPYTITWSTDTGTNTLFNPGTLITAAVQAPIVIGALPPATFSTPGVLIFQNSVLGLSKGVSVNDLIGYWPDNGYSLNSAGPFTSTVPTDSPIGQFVNVPTSQGNLTFTAMSNITLQITPGALSPVPALDEWGLVLLAAVLAVLAGWALRRRELGRR